jgi:hypothetical protein
MLCQGLTVKIRLHKVGITNAVSTLCDKDETV